MASSDTTVLRPYYDSNTFNHPHGALERVGLTSSISSTNATSSATNNLPISTSLSTSRAASREYDYLDIDVDAGSDRVMEIGKSMLHLYGRIFASQPWRVSRILLQLGDWDAVEGRLTVERKEVLGNSGGKIQGERTDVGTSDDEDEEIDYFTAVTGDLKLLSMRTKTDKETSTDLAETQQQQWASVNKNRLPVLSHQIVPETLHYSDVIGAIYGKDGVRGLWRGINASFVMDALRATIEAWLSGLFSSLSGAPDPLFLDIAHSHSPMASLGIAVGSSVVAAILVAPVDIIRTRLVVSRFETGPRSIRTSILQLQSWRCPPEVFLPTVLRGLLPCLVSKGLPYFSISRLGLDPVRTPWINSLMTLTTGLTELFVKLPLETLVRRSHVAYLNLTNNDTIVRLAEYNGVFTTIWSVICGDIPIYTLYRGWKVSALSVVGEWGVKAIQPNDSEIEKF